MEVVRTKGFRDRRRNAAAQSIKQQEPKPTKKIKVKAKKWLLTQTSNYILPKL